jgi:hypothetical protein
MTYANNPEEAQIDSHVLEAIKPSMPPEFTQTLQEKRELAKRLAEANPADQAQLRGDFIKNPVNTIRIIESATPDNFRAGIVKEEPRNSFRLLPSKESFRPVKEYPSTDEVSAKSS